MTVTLRTTANDKATNKGSALSHAELDANFVHFLDNGLTVVGDDSTGTAFTVSDDIKIAGGTNITTAVSGPTLTVTGATDITCNSLASSDSTAIQLNDALNVSGAITGGSTLTIDGASTLTGNVTASGTLGVTGASDLDGVQITDNKITTNASNSNLELSANGTGYINLSPTDTTMAIVTSNARVLRGTNLVYSDQALAIDGMTASANRVYANNRYHSIKADGTNVADSDARWQNRDGIVIDLNGSESTHTSQYSGPCPHWADLSIYNTAGSTNLGRLGNAMNVGGEGYLSAGSSNLTIDKYSGAFYDVYMSTGAGLTNLCSDTKGFHWGGCQTESGGGVTENFTKETAFYANMGIGDTKYLIDTDLDTALSNIGTLIKYREEIVALTDDSSLEQTVDCSLAPVHTFTIGDAAVEMIITNLGTGQSVTIILTQDADDSTVPNVTFYGSDSTAVKFPGGAPTITTETGAIDVITIFNDGTNLLGNIAQDFK